MIRLEEKAVLMAERGVGQVDLLNLMNELELVEIEYQRLITSTEQGISTLKKQNDILEIEVSVLTKDAHEKEDRIRREDMKREFAEVLEYESEGKCRNPRKIQTDTIRSLDEIDIRSLDARAFAENEDQKEKISSLEDSLREAEDLEKRSNDKLRELKKIEADLQSEKDDNQNLERKTKKLYSQMKNEETTLTDRVKSYQGRYIKENMKADEIKTMASETLKTGGGFAGKT